MSMLLLPEEKICYLLPLYKELSTPRKLISDLDEAQVRGTQMEMRRFDFYKALILAMYADWVSLRISCPLSCSVDSIFNIRSRRNISSFVINIRGFYGHY